MAAAGWIDALGLNELPESLRVIAEVVGVHNAVALTERWGGCNLYIPKAEAVLRPIRDRRIRQEFDGGNVRDLALKYHLTESWVREVLGQVDSGQLSLLPSDALASSS